MTPTDISTSNLAKNMAGEVALSNQPSKTLRKWRETFNIRQQELAGKLNITPSVISDYESGRRKSPGTTFIKKYIEKLIEIDESKGGKTIKRFTIDTKTRAILDIRELLNPIPSSELVKKIGGRILTDKKIVDNIKGYTIIDSIQAITEMSEEEFSRIYGSTTERALIFTKVHSGRSPMIAIKVTKPRPNMVVLHGLKPGKVDRLAVKIAEMEDIPLVVSTLKTEEELIERLRDLT